MAAVVAISLWCDVVTAAERTLDTAYGLVRINGVPKRVVTLGETALDASLTLDAHPLGALAARGGSQVPEYLQEKAGHIELVGSVREPNLEAVLALQPDLILATNDLSKQLFDQLSLIAPTVIPKVGSLDDWRASFRLYALALDKQAMAEERLKDFDHQVESLRQSIATGQSATVLRLNPQGPILMSAQVFAGQILASLGFLPNELAVSLKHRPHSDILSLENLTKADADWIFLATLNADGEKALDEVSGQPGFAQLKAVKDGHVVSVDGQVWSSSAGYMAAERILADIAKALAL